MKPSIRELLSVCFLTPPFNKKKSVNSESFPNWVKNVEAFLDNNPNANNQGLTSGNKLPSAKGLIAGRAPTNSKGLVNGNGLMSGVGNHGLRLKAAKGLTNGNGVTNGNGLTDGNGITNGNGLTNGNGVTNGNRFLRKHRKKEVLKSSDRNQIFINILVAAILIIAPLSLILLIEYPGANSAGIQVDGSFQDWNDVAGFEDKAVDQLEHPDINLVNSKVIRKESITSFYVEVKGNILEGDLDKEDQAPHTVRIFIDNDANPNSGYAIKEIGADYMCEIQGENGRPLHSPLYKFVPGYRTETLRGQNDWNAWKSVQFTKVVTRQSRLEAQVILPESLENIRNNKEDQIFALVQIMDSKGNEDFSDVIISNKPEMLIVTQKNLAPEILTDDISDVLEIEFTARGTDVTVNSISYNIIGNGKIIDIPMPIKIEKDTTKKYSVQLDITDTNYANFMNVNINDAQDISVSKNVPVTLSGTGASGYFKASPAKITIDGAFGDWIGIEKITDEEEDQDTVDNENVDIASYAVASTESDISFYLDVKGTMLKGSELPFEPKRFFEGRVIAPSLSSGTNYDNPLPDLPTRTGEDSLYVFLDTDHDAETGYCPAWFPIGADYMIETQGQRGRVISNSYYEFCGELQKEWSWGDALDTVDVGIDSSQFEAQITLEKLGINNIPSVYFHIVDWNRHGDYSDNPIMAEDQLEKERVGNGMRGVTNQLVINEIFQDSGVGMMQFIEIANPTSTNQGFNWYITHQQIQIYPNLPTTEAILLTIPCNIPAGFYYSFSPGQNSFFLADTLRLYDSFNNLMDKVWVNPFLPSTFSYQRYQDKDGNPYDTDSPSDWYMEAGNTMNAKNSRCIPEFPSTLVIIPMVCTIFIAIRINNKRTQKNKRKVI